MKRFDKSCYCIELRTGCLILGYYNVMSHLVRTSLAAFGLIYGRGVKINEKECTTAENAVLFVIHLSLVAITVVLLIGLHQNRRSHVKAYLIYQVVFMTLYSVAFFIIVFKPESETSSILWILMNIVMSVVFLLVIHTHFYRMEEKRPTRIPSIYNAL